MEKLNPRVRTHRFYSTPTPNSYLDVQNLSTLTSYSDSCVPVFSTPTLDYDFSLPVFLLRFPTLKLGFKPFRLRLPTSTQFSQFFFILSNSQLQLHTPGVNYSCNKQTVFLLLSLSWDFLNHH